LIRLNTFVGAFSKTPETQDDLGWPELVRELKTLTRKAAREKTQLPAFTLGTLTEAYNVNANYADHTALAIDVDSCPQETLDALDALGLALFAYASPSDPNPDGTRRVRIVAQLSQPIDPGDVRHARRAFAELLDIGPGQGVETADAVSQIMFAGQLHGTPKRETWQTEGEPLDAEAIVAVPLARQWRKTPKPGAVPTLERLAVADADERTAALLDALALHWEAPGEATGRRQILRALGGYLARRGWPDEQIAAVARGLETLRPEADRVALMVECARAARLDDSAAGWSSLAEWSPDAAAVIESVAKDPREPDGFMGVWAPCLARMFERLANAAQAEAYTPAATTYAADYDWTTPDEPIDWYCKALGIAPSERKITLIAGDPGSGKGPLSQHLAVCFAFGLKAFGAFECKQCNVGILDFEGARLSARRIKSHALGMDRKPFDLQNRIFLRDCDPGDIGFLHEWLELHSIKVLIVDSYMSAMASTDADPNSPEYAQLARELGKLGIVVIVIAHARKPAAGKRGDRPALGDVAGSYALGGMAATAIAVWNPDDDDRQLARIGCMRAPDEAFKTFDIRWHKSGSEEAPVWRGTLEGLATKEARTDAKTQTDAEARDEKLTRVADHIVASMRKNAGTPRTVTALARDTGLHHRDVGAVMAALERADLVSSQPERRGGSAFALAADFEGVTFSGGEASPGPARRRFGGFSV
jgi:hypothetical protein